MGKKNKGGKLGLKKDTLRRLDAQQMKDVAGGALYNFYPIYNVNYAAYGGYLSGTGVPVGAISIQTRSCGCQTQLC